MSTSGLITKTVDMKWESKCIGLSCKNVGYREIGRMCPVCHEELVATAAAMREAAGLSAVEAQVAPMAVPVAARVAAPVARRDSGWCIRCDGPLSYDPTGRGICDECRA